MSPIKAIVDTGPIILLHDTFDSSNTEKANRLARAEATFMDLRREGVVFIVPAPVITELGMLPGADGQALAESLFARFGGMRVEPFDGIAAQRAARMLRGTWSQRDRSRPRDGVKVDAMVAAVAVVQGAKYIVTTNQDDFVGPLAELQSDIEIVQCDAKKASKGQLRFIDTK